MRLLLAEDEQSLSKALVVILQKSKYMSVFANFSLCSTLEEKRR